MASGRNLEIPRLAPGSLDPFQPGTTYAAPFELARNLLLAGAGIPEDWSECHGDPMQFLFRTVQRAASVFDRRVIDGVAHTNLVLGTAPSLSGWREPEQQNPNRVFLSAEATHISVVYLRETLELLGKADDPPGLRFSDFLCGHARRPGGYSSYREPEVETLRVLARLWKFGGPRTVCARTAAATKPERQSQTATVRP